MKLSEKAYTTLFRNYNDYYEPEFHFEKIRLTELDTTPIEFGLIYSSNYKTGRIHWKDGQYWQEYGSLSLPLGKLMFVKIKKKHVKKALQQFS